MSFFILAKLNVNERKERKRVQTQVRKRVQKGAKEVLRVKSNFQPARLGNSVSYIS